MKKKLVWLLTGTLLFSAVGCSKKDSNIVKTADGKVTLCEYKGLSADKTVYNVTDEAVQEEIKSDLYEFVKYENVKRASKTGDILTLKVKATEGDTVLVDAMDETDELILGNAQYGEEVDKKLTGVEKGKNLSFKVTYAKDYEVEEWAGKTVQWNITVEDIVEEILPEPTDAFVKENFEYSSYEEMKTKVKERLVEEYATQGKYEVQEDLIQQVIDGSKIENESAALRDRCKKMIEDNYSSYASMYGFATTQEFYDAMGIDAEAIQDLEDNLVARSIVVAAIAKKEKISISDNDYKEGLERFTELYGYESSDALLEDYDETSIREWLLEEKVFDLLEQNATITEVPETEEEVTIEE